MKVTRLTLGELPLCLVLPASQGGPLSPTLSNILLDDLDKELERRGHSFCRYADDCNIYVKSRRAGERVMASVTRFLTERLRLTVNAAKSAVDRPWNRSFLGYSMTSHMKPRLKLAAKSAVRLRGILWRQWKRPWTRVKKLMARGLDEQRARRSAYSGRGPWWNAGASHMNDAYRKSYFDTLGLISVLDQHRRLNHAA